MPEEFTEVQISTIIGLDEAASPATLDALFVGSIAANGVQKPVGINKSTFELISGRKRVAACKLLGRDTVPARLLEFSSPLEAELYAIDDNLIEPKLTVLVQAKLLAKRKEVYEKLYPETKKGKAGGLASAKAKAGMDGKEQVTFSKSVAALKGQDKRTVETLVQIANKLWPEAEAIIAGSKYENRKKDLIELSRLQPEAQVKVANRLLGKDVDSSHLKFFTVPKNVRAAHLQVKREEYLKKSGNLPLEGKHYKLMVGDFSVVATTIAPNSVNAIITDMPYDKAGMAVLSNLAQLALEKLVDGGSLVIMAGHQYLPEFYCTMAQFEASDLHYRWHTTLAWEDGRATKVHSTRIIPKTKPVIIYTKGKLTGPDISDLVMGNGGDKRFHDWGQSSEDFERFIQKVSNVGDVILDPCMGGGCTAVAALNLNRKFIGIDIEPSCVDMTRAHIFEWLERKFKTPKKVSNLQTIVPPSDGVTALQQSASA